MNDATEVLLLLLLTKVLLGVNRATLFTSTTFQLQRFSLTGGSVSVWRDSRRLDPDSPASCEPDRVVFQKTKKKKKKEVEEV